MSSDGYTLKLAECGKAGGFVPERPDGAARFVVNKSPPTKEELARLADEGFDAVVDLRREGEPNQLMQPSQEAEMARKYNLRYVHLPVAGPNIDHQTIERVAGEIAKLPGRVLVHCASGRRAEQIAAAAQHLASAPDS